jgi:hypothetical protein
MKGDKMYIENPKTKGSGIICCIPQTGRCPRECDDCFFQNSRSYLEPLTKNLPNMPTLEEVGHRVLRVNDGNDSNVDVDNVIKAVKDFPLKFYNTSYKENLNKFDAPVVLTLNPGKWTDNGFENIEDKYLNKIMFVRIRANTWNLYNIIHPASCFYIEKKVPVVLTFMRYYGEDSIPEEHKKYYTYRKNIDNSYWKITSAGYDMIMSQFKYDNLIYPCGTEGELGTFPCNRCGNCLREFYATKERMEK